MNNEVKLDDLIMNINNLKKEDVLTFDKELTYGTDTEQMIDNRIFHIMKKPTLNHLDIQLLQALTTSLSRK